MDTSRDRLDDIELLSPVERGRQLEDFVADLFRRQHFTVTHNAGTARPRQTDLLAVRAIDSYLIECKWRSDKADVGDVDSLRSRLRRSEHSLVGLLISMAGFTGSVLHEVAHNRRQPILLLSGDELRRLAQEPELLLPFLRSKWEALRTDGTVLLDEPTRKRSRKRRRTAFPAADGVFVHGDGTRGHVVECAGQFGQIVFAQDLADIDWVPAAGSGVTLDIPITVRTERELLDLVERLADLGWATAEAQWSIRQTTKNWHGVGCQTFTDELPTWRRRAATPEAHHSEEISYVDRCDGGFYSFTAKLAAHRSRRVEFAHLSFQLHGIPLDNGPLLQLSRSVGVHQGLYFRQRTEESVTRHRPIAPYADDVRPLHHFVVPSQMPDHPINEWVTGIVIANPFHEPDSGQSPVLVPPGFDWLRDTEQLVCALHEHHPHQDGQRYTYRLTGFELARTTNVTVCRPVVTWDETA